MDMCEQQATTALSAATVLVVDDDLLVREPIADYLREVGYEVLEAGDAREAMDLVDHAAHVDLVFSDVRMPGDLDGVGLARWVRSHRPELPVLLTSGYDAQSWMGSELGREVRLIQKPYTQDQVLRQIRRLLRPNAWPAAPGREATPAVG
jgi:CheY-like chemotaxis protein